MNSLRLILLCLFTIFFLSCGNQVEEVTLDQANALLQGSNAQILSQTVFRPGPAEYVEGQYGGTWIGSITNDPKTFNMTVARDGDTWDVLNFLTSNLADYDPYEREFIADLAEFEVIPLEDEKRLDVKFTLKEDLYWTSADGTVMEKITSDDVQFWYDEIEGDAALQQPGYASQYVEMPDGSKERITIEVLDDRSFVFHFPRIVAEPILSCNMNFGPRYLYEPAKAVNGVNGVRDTLSVDWEVSSIPSMGPYHIAEYSPGVRVVLKRNPNYHKMDDWGNPLPYKEEIILKIVPDSNTEFLLFKSGEKSSYALRAEDLDELLHAEDKDYQVYNGGQSLGSAFLSFNQNPNGVDELQYSWFIQKEFRQAMSCLSNRQRMADQVYRGLAVPAHHFFAVANPMFDENIKTPYSYDPEKALELLEGIGMTRREDGILYDAQGNAVQFDINLGAENSIGIDMANILADEMKQIGIDARVRPIDFQKLVQMITETYEWQAVIVSLGPNYWPSGGSNVWQSKGNFHLWHPLQESPATPWEAEIDRLYNDGRFTLDIQERKAIYDQYQRILLEQAPLIYLVHPISFAAFRDGWGNIYYDTLGVPDEEKIFLLP